MLQVDNLDAAYGPYRALFGVTFSVPEGAVVALVGPNGAGKSTVARVVSGLVRPSAGRIRFAGHEVTGWPAWRIARLGLAHAPEGRSVFASLTVEENLVLCLAQAAGRAGLPDAVARAYEAFPRLRERRHQLAGTLSGGEQRLLTLARVLAVPQRLLVVDELSLGLAPAALDDVFGALERLNEQGTALLVVEQHVDRVLRLADRAVVLSHGRVVAEGAVAEVGEAIAALVPAHLPRPASGHRPGPAPPGPPAGPDAQSPP